MVAPMEGAYEKKAMGKESTKIKRCVGGKSAPTLTGLQNTPSPAAPCRVVNVNTSQIRSCLPPCTTVAPMQGAYEKEARGKESLQM